MGKPWTIGNRPFMIINMIIKECAPNRWASNVDWWEGFE